VNTDLIYVMPKDDVRAQLPLRYVCAVLGIALDQDDEACCPFHDDSSPSFGLYRSEDGTHDRWKCFPCGRGGDVFDLLIARNEYFFQNAVNEARGMLANMTKTNWIDVESRIPDKIDLDHIALSQMLATAQQVGASDPAKMAGLVGFDAGWGDILLKEWGWGLTSDGWTLIPHWDAAGVLTGIKVRGAGGAKQSIDGSKYRALYGSWRPYDARPVLFCEGEPDTVWASAFLPEWQVRGLCGANMFRREWVTELAGREVWLAFDGDEAGHIATTRWVGELAGKASSLYEYVVPDGHDLRTWLPTSDHIRRVALQRG